MSLKDVLLTYHGLFTKKGRLRTQFLKDNQEFTTSKLYNDIINNTSFLSNSSELNERIYCILNNIVVLQKCANCNSPVTFNTYSRGYRNYCSVQCVNLSKEVVQKRKNTSLERHGTKHYTNTKKRKDTCILKYGVEHTSKLDNVKEKVKQTKLERHSDEKYNNRDKAKQTNLEKYGTKNYNNRDKAKQTTLEKYGEDSYFKTIEFKNKAEQTNLEKYGNKYYNNRDKSKQTTLEKYGVEFSCQRHITKENLEKLNNKEWLIDEHRNQKKSLMQISKELKVTDKTVWNYFQKHNIKVNYFCQSYKEKLVVEYLDNKYNTEIITSSRSIIRPYELDIYLLEYNLAIEYNGYYWHRPDKFGSKEHWFNYHQNKVDMCKLKDIKLLHIWEDYLDHNALIDSAICGIIDNNLEEVYQYYKRKNIW